MECSVTGCIRGVFRAGFCTVHYTDVKDRPKCKENGCDKPVHGRGLCNQHYRAEIAKSAEPCRIDGCARPVFANGLCDAHRQRLRRHGHISVTRPADWGAKSSHPLYHTWSWHKQNKHRGNLCEEWQNDFWRFVKDVGERPSKVHKLRREDKSQPYGPTNYFWADTEMPMVGIDSKKRNALTQARYRKRHPAKRLQYRIKAAYGISLEEYVRMEQKQKKRCAICGEPEKMVSHATQEPRMLAVDHCHKHGHVRALLCAKCNGGLGNFNDDPDLLRKAITYLEKHALPGHEK